SWPTNYRGLVAIHAAKKWDQELRETCHSEPFEDALFGDEKFVKDEDIPRGCFIALGKLHRVLSTTEYAPAIPSMDTDEYWFDDSSPGRFMWVLDERWKLREPVYSAGHQGLWRLDEGVADVVKAMLPEGIEETLG